MKKQLFSISAVAVVLVIGLACGDSTSTSPTITPDPSGVQAIQSIGQSVGSVAVGESQNLSADAWIGMATLEVSGEFMKATITNPAKGPRNLGLACYQGQAHQDDQDPGTENHRKVVPNVPAGATVTIKVALHCGHNQCDPFFDLAEAPANAQFGSKRIPTGNSGLVEYNCLGCPSGQLEHPKTGKCMPLCEDRGELFSSSFSHQIDPPPPPPGFVPECICPNGTLPNPRRGCEEPEPMHIVSSDLHYSSTGWGGWSCPLGTTAIAGGVINNTYPMGAEGIAKPGATIGGYTYPTFPHWTFGPGETGYVAQNGGTDQIVNIWVDCLPIS